MVILGLLVICGLFAPFVAPYDPQANKLDERHLPPAWSANGSMSHILGTDHVGRDILSRVIYGARVSLMVVAVSLTSGFIVGTTIGLTTGYMGGWTDEIIMRLVDIWYSIPFLMIALVAVIIFGQSLHLLLALLALLAWAGFVRIVRGHVLTIKQNDYIRLARVAGAGHIRIMFKHVLPGVINTAVVVATLNVGGLILAEATLSFLGAGIPPPTPAWGASVSEGRAYLGTAWWSSLFPGLAIALTVLSLNFLGDWMRDHFDPRLRQLVN